MLITCEWNSLFICLKMVRPRKPGMWKVSVLWTTSVMAPSSVRRGPSMPQGERLSGYCVCQAWSRWTLYTLFSISNSQKIKKTHFLPLRSLEGRELPSTNYTKTDSEELTYKCNARRVGRRGWFILTKQIKESFHWILKDEEIGSKQEEKEL